MTNNNSIIETLRTAITTAQDAYDTRGIDGSEVISALESALAAFESGRVQDALCYMDVAAQTHAAL